MNTVYNLELGTMRFDLQVIASWIEPGSRVLDLGCGNGDLLAYLKTTPFFLFANYTLSVIPLFILMGSLAERGGLARDLFEKVSKALQQ